MKLIPAINEKFQLTPQQIQELSPELRKIIVVGGASMGTISATISYYLLRKVGNAHINEYYALAQLENLCHRFPQRSRRYRP